MPTGGWGSILLEKWSECKSDVSRAWMYHPPGRWRCSSASLPSLPSGLLWSCSKKCFYFSPKKHFFYPLPLLKRRLFVRSMMTFLIIYFWSTDVYVCKTFLRAKRSCNVITASRRNRAAHIQQACESIHGESAYTQSKPWSKQLVVYLLCEQFPLAWIVAIFGSGIQIMYNPGLFW